MENDDNNEPNIKNSASNLCFSKIMRKTWYCDKIYGHSTPKRLGSYGPLQRSFLELLKGLIPVETAVH